LIVTEDAPRVVLDTNILISHCLKPAGNEARVVALAVEGKLRACLSETVVAEYKEVAQRPKFAAQRQCLAWTVAQLAAAAEFVKPRRVCEACLDEDDNRLLECAAAAGAAYLVTGNLRHFPPNWEGVRVLNARALLKTLGEAAT
jgi:uncharacterized protein